MFSLHIQAKRSSTGINRTIIFCGLSVFRSILLISLYVCSLIALLIHGALASNSWIPVMPGMYAQLSQLTDPRGLLSIEDVRSTTNQERFQTVNGQSIHLGFTPSPLWLHLHLYNAQYNNQYHNQDFVLELIGSSLGHILLFPATDKAGQKQLRAGTQNTPVQGNLAGNDFLFYLHANAVDTTDYYLRIHSELPMNMHVRLLSPFAAGMAQAENKTLIQAGLSLVAYLFLGQIIAWVRFKRLMPLYYAFFLLSIGIYAAASTGLIGVYYWPYPQIQPHIELISMLLCLIAASCFTQSYLPLHNHTPWAHHWLSLNSFLAGLLILIMPWLPRQTEAQMYYGTSIYGALVIFWIILLSSLRHYKNSLILFSAAAPTILVLLTHLLDAWIPVPFSQSFPIAIFSAVLLQNLIVVFFVSGDTQRLRRKAKELMLNNRQAEKAIQLRNRVLQQISHEFRTPIGSILGMSELMINSSLSPRQHDFATTILLSTQSMLRTLKELVDFTQHQERHPSKITEPFELDELLLECLSIFQEPAEEKHLELVGSRDPELPNKVVGDPGRLRQLISTLLRNSVRYTLRGEISLTLIPGSAANTLRCEVRDTGIGIPANTLNTLFGHTASGKYQNFSTEHDLHSADGLDFIEPHQGLTLCRQWVQQMGGKMGAESKERQGSCLWFEVPCSAQPTTPLPALPYEELLHGLHLLIVDDNRTAAQVIAQQCKSWGIIPTVCASAAEAIALTRNAMNLETPFDVVILDQNMPGMNGLELAAQIREDPLIINDVLMIMLSGIRLAPTQTMTRNVGIRRILTKPITSRELKIALTQELGIIRGLQSQSNPNPNADDLQKLQRLRVLIAEDNYLSQKVIRGMVQKIGLSCAVVVNGQEAFEEILRHRYDIILMDCDMPLMDGYRATQAIRRWEKDNHKPHIPILALTAHMIETYEARSLEVGMNEHLNKPLELSQLRDAILRWA